MKLFISLFIFILAFNLFASELSFNQMSDEEKFTFLTTNAQVEVRSLSSLVVEQILPGDVKEGLVSAKSELWLDTILEGDYALTGETGLTKLTAFIYQGQVLAYELEFKAPAVMTAKEGCTYNEESDSWSGASCVKGTISEKSLVDASFAPIWNYYYPEFTEAL